MNTAIKVQQRLNDMMILIAQDFLRRIEESPASFDERTLRDVANFLDSTGGETRAAMEALLGVSFDTAHRRLNAPRLH